MKKFIALFAALPLVFGIAACGSEDEGAQYAGVCVDPNTNVRLDDSNCSGGGNNGGGMDMTDGLLLYMLLSSNHSYPGIGYPVQRNYFVSHLPSGASYTRGLPRTGGSSVKSWSKSKFGSTRAPASKSYGSNGKTIKPKSTYKAPKSSGSTTKKKSGGWSWGGSKSSGSRKSGGFSSRRR